MPYIITNTEGREAYEQRRAGDPGAYRNQGISRRAVATLGEAHRLVWDMLPGESQMAADDWHAAFMLKATFPESGGTVHLPGGTVIEVEPAEWVAIAASAGLPNAMLAGQDIIDAFNARQS